MTFISYVNFFPSFVTLVTVFLLSLLLLTLMTLAMMESVASGEDGEPSSQCIFHKKSVDASRVLFRPCKVSDCAEIGRRMLMLFTAFRPSSRSGTRCMQLRDKSNSRQYVRRSDGNIKAVIG